MSTFNALVHVKSAKITITTFCGAKCRSCPSWRTKNETMDIEIFRKIYLKIANYPYLPTILLNNVGDFFALPNWKEYLDFAIDNKNGKRLHITTNGLFLNKVKHLPEGIDNFTISFNGFSREGYEYMTGMPFDIVYNNIKRLHESGELYKPEVTELHMLRCKINDEENFEDKIRNLFGFLRCKIRVSHKCENQFGEDITLDEYKFDNERIFCDYLIKLNVHWNGDVILCAHDFSGAVVFGNLVRQDIPSILRSPFRIAKLKEHLSGRFTGLCFNCNYNLPDRREFYKEFYFNGR